MKKSAILYERGGVLFLSSSSLTTAGVLIDTDPLLRIEPGSKPSAIGEAVVTIINAFQESVPHPSDWKALTLPLLQLAGVRSWHTFMKKSRCVAFVLDGGQLKMTPCRNLGKGGFEPITEQISELPFSSSPDDIGGAVIDSIKRCKDK